MSVLAATGPSARADEPADRPGLEKPYGLEKRVPWTTSRVRGTPDPPPPYRTEPAFPSLRFAEPLAMAARAGERPRVRRPAVWQVLSFPNDPKVGKAELVLDLGRPLFGLALHPDFARNGYLFVSNLLEPAGGRARRMRVSRLKVGPFLPPRGDPRSERVLIEWPSLYHDGGCLAFGATAASTSRRATAEGSTTARGWPSCRARSSGSTLSPRRGG